MTIQQYLCNCEGLFCSLKIILLNILQFLIKELFLYSESNLKELHLQSKLCKAYSRQAESDRLIESTCRFVYFSLKAMLEKLHLILQFFFHSVQIKIHFFSTLHMKKCEKHSFASLMGVLNLLQTFTT